MQRIIKFRAWDKAGGEMLSWGQIYKELIESHTDVFTEEGYEVMQYTGLLDKNGVEIYEGDVLRLAKPRSPYHKENQILEVVFGERKRYNNETIPHEGFVGFSFISHTKGLGTVFDESEIEVIGNIYEHKHLISKEEK